MKRFYHVLALLGFFGLIVGIGGKQIFSTLLAPTHAASFPSSIGKLQRPASGCGPWQVSAAIPASTTNTELNGVAALSSTNVWVVGGAVDAQGNMNTVVEHWDGSSWSIIPSPNVDGTSGDILNAVVARSSSDIWAVGQTSVQPLIEHWDGSSWSVIPSPLISDATLTGLARVPGSNQLWAVGFQNGRAIFQPLVEYWDGTIWKTTSAPNPGTSHAVLSGVTAFSGQDVWAVGQYNPTPGTPSQTLVEHWNGKAWSVVPSPNPASANGALHSITSLSQGHQLWATGVSMPTQGQWETLIEHWDGTSWSIVPSPNQGPEGPSSVNSLSSVVALSSNNVWAVGAYQQSNGVTASHTLVEHWNGSTWSILPSPDPSGNALFNAVTRIPGTYQLWAVGESYATNTGYVPLVASHC